MSHVATMALLLTQVGLRANIYKISLGSMPPDPPSLACLCINCIHIRPPPCNPSSKNPGYRPASNMAIRCFNIYHMQKLYKMIIQAI